MKVRKQSLKVKARKWKIAHKSHSRNTFIKSSSEKPVFKVTVRKQSSKVSVRKWSLLTERKEVATEMIETIIIARNERI